MPTDERLLPQSLTRLLAVPPSARRPPAGRGLPRALPHSQRTSAHDALESALLRGFVYGVSGLVWLVVMLFIGRHLMR
ncbi:hypothetical protein [Methylobacterium sp. SI9]|uniref:hypothetical protein n=1 Tax=Methylobacterium guangdongense TaxID=3138811 RepID=UPI00313AE633